MAVNSKKPLVLGAYYKDRMGRMVGPIRPNYDPDKKKDFPFKAACQGLRHLVAYTETGRFRTGAGASGPDIVGEPLSETQVCSYVIARGRPTRFLSKGIRKALTVSETQS